MYNRVGLCIDQLKPFFDRKLELSLQDGCLLWGSRVIIPPPGRQQILQELHNGHPGISRMKAIARGILWWPGLDKCIESCVQSCYQCQLNRPALPIVPLQPWQWPSIPWSRIHIDYAGPIQGKMLLVLIDSHSKWIETHVMNSSTSSTTIECLRSIFSQFGLPNTIVTDNGPSFASAEFKNFLSKNGITHTTSAPYHPSSNGLAERAVQIVKQGIKKLQEGSLKDKVSRTLFTYRTTPHTTTGQTPAEMLFQYKLRTRYSQLVPDIQSRVVQQQQNQKMYYDRKSATRSFQIGDLVLAKNYSLGHRWLSLIR